MYEIEGLSQVHHTTIRTQFGNQMWAHAPPDRVTKGLSRTRGVFVAQNFEVSMERERGSVPRYRVACKYLFPTASDKNRWAVFRGELASSSIMVGILSTVSCNVKALARLTSQLLRRVNPIWRISECEKTHSLGPV